ncbi:MAG: 2-phosphosulfolactate phosphatase [Chlorobi bacterium]|nr:2-phosphosulfolactate phosphatase [Chlorobiota bacterium]MCI0716311.1 2-phosphosulfolactate phosphatase [Chlorobiota bacterium]
MEVYNQNLFGDKTIKVSLYFAHDYLDSELDLKDKNVVVVDVLRTSTTMITGLANGAKEIIPTDSIASAGMIGRNSGSQALLCGERNAKMIEGFNLGNSIKEYSEENVKGKILVFNSTNGTPSLMKAKFSRNCVVLGFVNISRVAKYFLELKEDFIIMCAGRNGAFSLEDTVCAGMLVSLMLTRGAHNKIVLTDSSLGASKLYSSYKKDLLKMLQESEHGIFLTSIGFEDDLNECGKVDVYNLLPVLKNGVIKSVEAFAADPKLTMKKITQKNAG